ncbi:MAG: polymorphic toxin-type HINT domain-containing protein, partial [Candidatus Nanoarchaeia archaeon]|nr:polymorphic toxin-type HINT domain-containing protein [Candidatus Nanoarchaeia archaeon]
MKKRVVSLKLILILIIFIIWISIFDVNFISAQTNTLKVTSEHPFLVDGNWIPAKELSVGDELNTLSGEDVVITKITKIAPLNSVEVYNLEAGVYHNFVVEDNLIVHNSNVPVELQIDSVDLNFLSSEEISKLDLASVLLDSRTLSEYQKKAVIAAHRYGTRGADGYYSYGDVKMKIKILKKAFSCKQDYKELIAKGVAGSDRPVIHKMGDGNNVVSVFEDTQRQFFDVTKYPQGMTFEQFQSEFNALTSGLTPSEITQTRMDILNAYGDGLWSAALESPLIRDRALAIQVLRVLGEDVDSLFQPRTLSYDQFKDTIWSKFIQWKGGNDASMQDIIRKYPELRIYQLKNKHWRIELIENPDLGVNIGCSPSDTNAGKRNATQLRQKLEQFWKSQTNRLRIQLGMP